MRKTGIVGTALVLAAGLAATAALAAGDGARAAQAPVLTVAEAVAPTTLDPQASSLGADWNAWQLAYQCLLTQRPNGALAPQLATKYATTGNGTKYTFTLRKGVVFHNGDPLTSADVVATFQRLQKTGIPYAQSRFSTLKSVRPVGKYGVQFTLTQRDPSFVLNMADPAVVACAILDKNVIAKGNPALQMVGTGPYKVSSYTQNQELDLTSFDRYWGSKPANGGLKILYVPDALTQAADLKSGKVDLIFPDSSLVQTLKSDRSVKLQSVVSGSIEELDINSSAKPFDDVRVRQAVALAVDREAIAKVAFNGAATPTSYLPPSLPWAPSLDSMPNGKRDVDKAKELLKAAGYPNGFDTKLMYIAGYSATSTRVVTLLQSQLGAVGIHVTLDPLEQAVWNDNLNKPDYQLSWNFYSNFSDPYQYLRPRPGRQGPTPPSLQSKIDRLQSTTPSTYHAAVAAIAREEAKLVFPDIALVAWKSYVAFRPSVHHVKLPASLVRTFLTDVSVSEGR